MIERITQCHEEAYSPSCSPPIFTITDRHGHQALTGFFAS